MTDKMELEVGSKSPIHSLQQIGGNNTNVNQFFPFEPLNSYQQNASTFQQQLGNNFQQPHTPNQRPINHIQFGPTEIDPSEIVTTRVLGDGMLMFYLFLFSLFTICDGF